MGTYGTIYFEILDTDTCKWNLCPLYKFKDGYKKTELWCGQGYIRDILQEDLFDYSDAACVNEHSSDDFYQLSDDMLKIYHEYDEEYIPYMPETSPPSENRIRNPIKPMVATYAQILEYIKNNPTIDDYYELYYDEEKDEAKYPQIENPMQEILDRMTMMADMVGEYSFDYEYLYKYRIVYWVI